MALVSDSMLMALIFTALSPALPAIGQHFNGDQQGRVIAQMIMTMPSIGLIVGGLIAGRLIDQLGPRAVLMVGLFGFAILGSAGLYIDHAALLLLSRFFLGISSTIITTAATWLLGSLFDPAARAELLGYRNAFGSLGGVLSTFLAGPVAEAAGWRGPFSFYLVALPVLMLVAFMIPKPVAATLSSMKATSSGTALAHIWPVYAVAVPTAVLMFATITQVSFLLADHGFTSPTTQAWVIGMGSLTSMVGATFYGRIKLLLGSTKTFVLLLGLMGTGNILIGLSATPVLMAIGTAIAGWGSGVATPYFCNLILDRVAIDLRGRALGFLYSAMFFGDFLNPFVFGPISLLAGLQNTFILIGMVVTACAALVWLIEPRWSRE